MSQQTPPNISPEEQQRALEEARKQFEAAKAKMDRQVAQGREVWGTELARVRSELEEARATQATAIEKRDKVAPKRDEHPALFGRLEVLVEVFGQLANLKAAQIACYERGLAELEAIGPLDSDAPPAGVPALPQAADDLTFLEARARLDAALLDYYWRYHAAGLEAVLRASGNEATPAGADEEAVNGHVEALRQALKTDKELLIMLGRLGGELLEARALLEWGASSLKTVGQLPEGARRQALTDNDWAKLNASVQLLLTLGGRVKGIPALAALFEPLEPIASA
jgi:hypothetical protein